MNRRTTAETDAVRQEADLAAELLNVSYGRIILTHDEASLRSHNITTQLLIELRLFVHKFNEKQMVLLLDGFDEVASYYKTPVLNCFKRFGQFNRLQHIYISSRPYDFEEDFRQTFQRCRMYRLKPLSCNDQRVYLNNFLTRNVKDYKRCERIHRQLVLCILYGIINKALDDVKTVPLLLNMAFHQILPAVEQCINFRLLTIDGKIYDHNNFGTLQLVETFVERKLEIAYIEKTGTTDCASTVAAAKKNYQKLSKQVKQDHALLAVYFMFSSQCRSKLLSKREQRQAEDLMQEVMNAQEQTGLIDGIRDGIPLFIHRIFAEYCVACWLHTNVERLRKESYFQSRSFWTYGLKRTRDFLNRMIIGEGGGSDIHLAVLNDSTEEVLKLLTQNPSLALKTDADSRMPLHLAVTNLCNRDDIRNALLKQMEVSDLNAKDDLFLWSALDYAFVANNESVITELLKLGVEVNVDAFLKQLFSNELDVILRQGVRYCALIKPWESNKGVTSAIYKGIVKHLLRTEIFDIYASEEKLGSLSVLEYCTKRKMFEMFREFVQRSGEPARVLADVAADLLQVAFEVHAHDIINYLLNDCNFPIPRIKCSRNLIYALKSHIRRRENRTFKIVLNQLLLQRNLSCADEESIVEEYPDTSVDELSDDLHPKVCCVLDPANVKLPLEEYDEYEYVNDAIVFEQLLSQAVHEGNFALTSYIVQKKQMIVTSSFVAALMRLIPKGRGVRHARSMQCYKYLLDRTVDLYSTDTLGRNLLHMAVQNGCFFMVHCLLKKGFDPTLVNNANGWNVFHYAASCVSVLNNRALKLFAYLTQVVPEDCLNARDAKGISVIELAVDNENFKEAQWLIESKFDHSQPNERFEAMENIVRQMIATVKEELVSQFLEWCVSHAKNSDWHETYHTLKSLMLDISWLPVERND
uniref:NACHT domain-containing protein n=1 Tax=Anopheles farauti TaxID=69004 RepID=A0A182QL13_9DIPT